MTDEPTKDLSDSEKLDLILADLADVKKRLGAQEATAEDRSRDTKPLLAELHNYVAILSADVRELRVETAAGFTSTNARLQRMDRRFETLAGDMVDLRNRQSDVETRVDEIERRPS